MFRKAGILTTACLLIISSVVFSSPASAQALPSPPSLDQQAVSCYRSIIQTGDLFCLNRFDLPVSDTEEPAEPEAWCAYLVNSAGCTESPVVPEEPWTLQLGAAFITVNQSDALLGQVQVPRIGNSLGGVYFEAGHGITWGDTNVTGCVETSPTLFSEQGKSCLPVLWNEADNTQSAQRAALGTVLTQYFVAIEEQSPLIQSGTFVQANRLTNNARIIALETLNVIDRILEDTFQSEATPLVDGSYDYATPTSNLDLQDDISATATAVAGAFDDLGTETGFSGDWIGMAFFTVLGTVAFGVTVRANAGESGAVPLSVVAFLTTMLIGVTVSAVPVAVAAVTAVLIGAIGILFMLRKMAL